MCFFLQCLKEFQGSNSGHQVTQQVPLLDMPSCWSPVSGTFQMLGQISQVCQVFLQQHAVNYFSHEQKNLVSVYVVDFDLI